MTPAPVEHRSASESTEHEPFVLRIELHSVEDSSGVNDALNDALQGLFKAQDPLRNRRVALALTTLKTLVEADEPRELDAVEAALPRHTKSKWDDAIGPFYSVQGVAGRLGVSRQAVHERIKRGTLLATPTADGVVLVPTFQLNASNLPLPHLKELRKILHRVAPDPWALALWLNTAVPGELDNRTPGDALRDSTLAPEVIRLAQRDAQQAAA